MVSDKKDNSVEFEKVYGQVVDKNSKLKTDSKKVEELIDPDEKPINPNITFGVAVLVLILFISIFFGVQAYKLNVAQDKYQDYAYYNNYAFITDGQFWATHVTYNDNYIKIPSYYHPYDLENISIEGDVIDFINSKNSPDTTIYITIDPDIESKYSSISANEYYKVLHPFTKVSSFETNWAILHMPTTYETNVTSYPIIDCINATNNTIVIKQIEGTSERIYREGSCIILEADSYKNNLRTADRFLFGFLGIMN